MDTPTYLPAADRVIVIGDVHGDLSRMLDILYGANVINRKMQWIAEPRNTVVVQLGDQIDSASRLPQQERTTTWEKLNDIEVLKFMDELDTIARPHGGRVISMIGNHELMNVLGDFSYVSPTSMAKSNGKDMRQRMFAAGGDLAYRLSRRNVVQKIGSLLFVHGGILPQHLNVIEDRLHVVNEAFRKFLRKDPSITEAEHKCLMQLIFDDAGFLWTRKYMELQSSPHEFGPVIDEVLTRTNSKMIFVGHNTVSNISTFQSKLWFTDSGLSRAYGNDGFEALDVREDGKIIHILRLTTQK